jgi:hypothetical protein
MAGLNDLVTNKETSSTTLPSWYSTAQQSLVNQATGVNAPAIGDTAAQSAVNAFGQSSPFAAGQNILQSIGSGAANPWLVSTDATGAQTVSPNVNTAMGGLFQSQKDYLNELMPDIDAATTAGSIAGGGFGSRMNLSGIANARANAASDLFQKQMQSALQNQQTGVSAGVGMGNVGQQGVQSALNTGTFQQNAPYAGATNLASILSKIQPDQTATKSVELGGLNQIMGLLAAGSGGLNSLMGRTVVDSKGNQVKLPGIIEQIKGLYNEFTGGAPDVSSVEQLSNPSQPGDESYGWEYYSDGTVIAPWGDYYQNGELIWSPSNNTTSDESYGADNQDYFDYFGSEGE